MTHVRQQGGFNNWSWNGFGKAAGIGAISGVVTMGIGNAFGAVGSGGFWGEVARAYTHGFANGMISEFTGGDFMQGFAAGGLGSLAGSGFQAWGGAFAESAAGTIGFSAITGGIGEELSGGDFWRGAATGATVAGLNHLSHMANGDDPLKKQIEKLGATASTIGYTADGAELLMATYSGKAIYYTKINGQIKWIPTSRVTKLISGVGKTSLIGGFAVDGLMFATGNQSGAATLTSLTWAGGTALLKLGLRGNIASGLMYGVLFSGFDQPGRPIYYKTPLGVQDNTKRVLNIRR